MQQSIAPGQGVSIHLVVKASVEADTAAAAAQTRAARAAAAAPYMPPPLPPSQRSTAPPAGEYGRDFVNPWITIWAKNRLELFIYQTE